jgi:hypothetical protein
VINRRRSWLYDLRFLFGRQRRIDPVPVQSSPVRTKTVVLHHLIERSAGMSMPCIALPRDSVFARHPGDSGVNSSRVAAVQVGPRAGSAQRGGGPGPAGLLGLCFD